MTRGLLLLLLPGAAWAQEVAPCDPAPPVTALIEPWEETAAALAGGAVRLAVLEGEQGTRRLLVLTLPPPEGADAPDASGAPVASDAAPPARLCRIVAEGGLGFADLDLAGIDSAEDPEAATLTLRLPALGFVPESTELRPETLVLTLGVADGSLAASIEGGSGGEDAGNAGDAP